MVKLANERVVQLRLPFLDKGKLHSSKIGSSREEWYWRPNEKNSVISPVPQGQLGLHKSFMCQLKVFPVPRMFSVQDSVCRRANIELRLHVLYMCEAYVHGPGLKKSSENLR